MLPLLLGKQPCLNFTVTFLFSPVAGIFEHPVKNFAILLIVTIAFPEKKILPITNDKRKLHLTLVTHTHHSFLLVIYFSNIKRAFSFQTNKYCGHQQSISLVKMFNFRTILWLQNKLYTNIKFQLTKYVRSICWQKNVSYLQWEITFSNTIMFTPKKKCMQFDLGKVYYTAR